MINSLILMNSYKKIILFRFTIVLATEVYKVIHGLSPEIMKDIFELGD